MTVTKLLDHLLITIISHRRPGNVQALDKIFDGRCPVIWIVGLGETALYRANGARTIIEGGGLCESRNRAIQIGLDRGFRYVLQISDDVVNIRHISLGQMSAETAALGLMQAMGITNYRLAGAYPVDNEGWASARNPFSFHNFIVGDFIVVDTSSPVRFDTRLKVKEDYDFTMAHISAFGGVVRANHLLVKARHRTNAGGACTKARAKHDANAISILRKKWKRAIRSHTRRKLEIVIHVPKLDKKQPLPATLNRLAYHSWSSR